MKYLLLILATFVIALAGPVQTGSGSSLPRETTLTDGWRFHLDGESGPERADFDDSAWAAMNVPHNGQEISNELPASTRAVWYRRRVELPAVPAGHRLLLDVLGTRRIQAWVNGVEAGRSAEFQHWLQVDVTRLVRTGPNTLVLRTTVPGIQGYVRLVALAPVDFEPDGIRVDTPGWKGGPAGVRIRTTVENTSASVRSFQATARVLGPEGNVLASVRSSRQTVSPRAKSDLELLTERIANPPLWSPGEPRLCRVVVELQEEGEAQRSCEATFGFRWFGFDPDKGFSFNGRPLKLRGTVFYKIGPNRFANRRDLWRYELGLLRGMGINIVRTAAGIDESILDEFDRAGILTTLDVNADADLASVAENMRQDIRRRYNHPSIITWHFNGEGKDARFSALYSEAARAIRSLDSGRPVLCVELGWRSPGTVGLIDADIAGQGNYTGWYEGTLEHIGPYMDTYRELLRERYGRYLPILVSNYGAASDPEVHRERPRRNDFSHQYHTAFHRRFESEIARRPWMAGGLIFAWRDSVSGQPIPRHTWKGVLDMQDRKKDAYFYYQSIWTKEPMVHIREKSWTSRDLWPAGRTMQVEVFSNCDVVELFRDGKTLGRRKRGEPFTWDVRFAEGENLLRATGEGSKKVEDTVSIRVRFAPPAVEPRLTSAVKGTLRLEWEPVAGVRQYAVHGATRPDFEPSLATLLGTTVQPWFETKPQSYGAYYRVVALAAAPGVPSEVIGWGPGAMQWRFANSGWLLSSPAVADLDGDGRLEIMFGSYNGSVYALTREGRELWRFDTGGTVLASPVVASLRKGERPSVVFNSDGTLYILGHDGRLRWKHAGIRQFDRSVKSPSLGDLDGDGNLEIVVASDTGEVLALDSAGRVLWRHKTAGTRTAGLSLTTPIVISEGARTVGIAVGADDGSLQFLDPQGKLRWKRDLGLGDTTPGLVPNILTPAAGPLQEGGPVRIVSGAGGLRVFELDGKVVWERMEIRGAPQISALSGDGTRRIVVSMAAVLWAVDARGRDLWRFTLENRRDFFSQAPASADLDGDGRSDLIVGARSTHLYAISSEGKLLWRFKTDDELSGSPAVADLQGDGYAEVIWGSRDGFLYVVGAGAADGVSLQYRGDPGRTGDYARRVSP